MRGNGKDTKETASAPLTTAEEHAAVYAAVIASALDAVIVVDEAGKVVAMNPAAEATFGYRLDEAMGKSIGALIVPDHLKDAHEQGMARYRATREPHVLGRRVELEARCKDGRIIPVELAITEVNLPERRLFTANLRDLSAAKESAAEIDRQRDALHQSEKLAALGSLLAGVAHELNNPLSIVLGQAVMMREAAEAGDVASIPERVGKIEAAAERCARVVRSFLAIARRRKAEKQSVALAPLLDGAIDLLQYSLRSGGIEIVRATMATRCPKPLPIPIRFSRSSSICWSTRRRHWNRATGAKEIRVSAHAGPDGAFASPSPTTDPAFRSDIAARIFDPFFTTKPQGSGTGIGLSVSRGLAQAQGGHLAMVPSPLGVRRSN
jgi:PAS domain S-box-containing protein